MQTQIKCLAIRIPSSISKYPMPTFYRELTKRNLHNGKIEVYTRECIYWLDSIVYSDKQLSWLGDIKTKIIRLFPEAEIVAYQSEANYHTASGQIFNLKSLQQSWTRKIVPKKKSILNKIAKEDDAIVDEEMIQLPALPPLTPTGKIEYKMYKALCQYATRLHYEKLLQFEYMHRACKIYNKNSEEKILPKKLLKLTHKAFDFISEEIVNNPDNFKQKLNPKELRNARIKNATKLQANNKKIRENNVSKVKEAIATDQCYKLNGDINSNAIVRYTSLNRQTVNTILSSLLVP